MNDEALNNDIRRFLKKVGIQSHQAIQEAIRNSLKEGKLDEKTRLKVRMQLSIDELDLKLTIDGEINVDSD